MVLVVEDLTGGETVLLVDVMFGTGSVAAAAAVEGVELGKAVCWPRPG